MSHMALGFKEFPCNEVLSSGLFPFCFILSRQYYNSSSLGQFNFHIRTVGSELKSQRGFLSLFFQHVSMETILRRSRTSAVPKYRIPLVIAKTVFATGKDWTSEKGASFDFLKFILQKGREQSLGDW